MRDCATSSAESALQRSRIASTAAYLNKPSEPRIKVPLKRIGPKGTPSAAPELQIHDAVLVVFLVAYAEVGGIVIHIPNLRIALGKKLSCCACRPVKTPGSRSHMPGVSCAQT